MLDFYEAEKVKVEEDLGNLSKLHKVQNTHLAFKNISF